MRAGPTTAPPRARPVADAPVSALVDGADELAKAWVLELVAAAPLAASAGLRLDELAAEGPGLCRAVARALGDDEELARLEEGGDLFVVVARAGALAGAGDPASAFRAVEALRRATWEAALGALSRPSAALGADLADRLRAVCAAVPAAVLAPRAADPVIAPAPGPAPERPLQQTIRESISTSGMDRLADLARAAAEEAVQASDLRAEPPIMR